MTKKRSTTRKPLSSLSPYITVRGASEAIQFYKKVLGAKEVNRINAPETELVQHAELKICRTKVYLCDEFPELGVLGPQSLGGSSTTLHVNVSDAQKVWDTAMAEGAFEVTPLTEVSWGGICGKLMDPFGHYWSIASEVSESFKSASVAEMDVELMVHSDTEKPFDDTAGC